MDLGAGPLKEDDEEGQATSSGQINFETLSKSWAAASACPSRINWAANRHSPRKKSPVSEIFSGMVRLPNL